MFYHGEWEELRQPLKPTERMENYFEQLKRLFQLTMYL